MFDLSTMQFIRRILDPLAILCGYAVVALSVAICLEVLLRRFFHFSLQGVDEIGGYIVSILVPIGFTLALIHNEHTRMDFLLQTMPKAAAKFLEAIAALLMLALSIFLAQRAYVELTTSIDLGSRATTPLATRLWIPQMLWFIGLLLFAIAALQDLWQRLSSWGGRKQKG